MSWLDNYGLSKRILNLPLILCGPILRRVEPASVSVFVALKRPRQIKLTVYKGFTRDDSNKVTESDPVEPIRLGKYLYVAVVTAKVPPALPDLEPGITYGYDLSFTLTDPRDPDDNADNFEGDGQSLSSLGLLTGLHALGYMETELPTFSLPPKDLNYLRVVHGSCRKPNGVSADAFEALDMMIESTRVGPDNRPHQLFLTGDQIYADEVADDLLMMLTDAGDMLLGWKELEIRDDSSLVEPKGLSGVRIAPKDLKPGYRTKTVKEECGFTTDDHESHLLSLAEYFAMYLFAWSDVLWPVQFPEFEDIYPLEPKKRPSSAPVPDPERPGEERYLLLDSTLFVDFSRRTGRVASFRDSLPQVRRALANVPTYMIFDDHEVTDDWYLNFDWCESVLSKPFGMRVIQNALVAYAVFQGWGNTPDRFEPGQFGGNLLKAVQDWSQSGGTDKPSRNEVNHRVGITDTLLAEVQANKRLTHPVGSLEWHYTVSGPNHEVLALDSRTWREFPGAPKDRLHFCALLSGEGFASQVLNQTQLSKDITILLSPGPVLGVPFILDKQKALKTRDQKVGKEPEHWGIEKVSFESLLASLARRSAKMNEGGTTKRRSRIVVISGDVHYAFAAHLQYWADHPFADPQPLETEMVVIQFTSSPFKNKNVATALYETDAMQLHTKGFEPLNLNVLPKPLERMGWENHGGGRSVIGKFSLSPVQDPDANVWTLDWTINGRPDVTDLTELRGIGAFEFKLNPGIHPDWRYRIDYILAESEVRAPAKFAPKEITAPPPGDRRKALREYYARMGENHKKYASKWGDGKEVVAENNIGEITFQWDAQTTLSSRIDENQQSFVVGNAPRFPSSLFYILVDQEVMRVGGHEGNTFSGVERGVGGTSAAPHSDGARVELIDTAIQALWWRPIGRINPAGEPDLTSAGQVPQPFPLTKAMVSLRFNDPRYPVPQAS